MKGMVIRMNASKTKRNGGKGFRQTWGMTLRVGILSMVATSILLFGVSCTRNGDMDGDGTVVDSSVGSVTSAVTEKNTAKDTEKATEARTEARTENNSEHGSGMVTTPGTTVPGTTVPGTTPGTDATSPAETNEHGTTAVTTVPGTAAKGRYGKG